MLPMQYKFNKSLYPKEAIVKAAYFFTDRFYVTLDTDETYYHVTLAPKTEDVSPDVEKEFTNEVLAQANRHLIASSTRHIRELIVGRALASTMIDNKDQGFVDDSSISADDILVNWFDKHE